MICRQIALIFLTLLYPVLSFADADPVPKPLDLTSSWAGYLSLGVIFLAYATAMFEDMTLLRKSKPMLFGATVIWVSILIVYQQHGDATLATKAFKENLQAYIELLLFIMVSMTYLNVLEDMKVFDALRLRLMKLNLGYRSLFWITGFLVFFLSCVVNGLTELPPVFRPTRAVI